MKTKLMWIVPVILAVNLILNEIIIQQGKTELENYQKDGTCTETARNVAKRLNISLTLPDNRGKIKLRNESELKLLNVESINDIYAFYQKIGLTKKDCDEFIKNANKYIKAGNLSYMDMFGILNFDDWEKKHYNEGFHDGKVSMLPENLKSKNVAQIVIEPYDYKDKSQYFNAHISFLLKVYDEAISLGLFMNSYCSNIFWKSIDWVLYMLEDYYFNPELRMKKEKIFKPFDDERNISMEDIKKGN